MDEFQQLIFHLNSDFSLVLILLCWGILESDAQLYLSEQKEEMMLRKVCENARQMLNWISKNYIVSKNWLKYEILCDLEEVLQKSIYDPPALS